MTLFNTLFVVLNLVYDELNCFTLIKLVWNFMKIVKKKMKNKMSAICQFTAKWEKNEIQINEKLK